eukprot:CCRYP_011459-RA/>CCRYP_011459-RA protein AED:0.44 eAED:0.44 QI:0/-1/0/1/-1/1/1/0/128
MAFRIRGQLSKVHSGLEGGLEDEAKVCWHHVGCRDGYSGVAPCEGCKSYQKIGRAFRHFVLGCLPGRKEEEVQWEKALQDFGKRHGLTKHCGSVIHALEEIQLAEGQYCALVELENGAVSNAQDVEHR